MREYSPIELSGRVTKSAAYFRHARWKGRRQCPRCGYRGVPTYICPHSHGLFEEAGDRPHLILLIPREIADQLDIEAGETFAIFIDESNEYQTCQAKGLAPVHLKKLQKDTSLTPMKATAGARMKRLYSHITNSKLLLAAMTIRVCLAKT